MKNKLNIALITAGNPRHHYFKKKISSVVDAGLIIEEPKKSKPTRKEISFFKNRFLDDNWSSKNNKQININDRSLNSVETQYHRGVEGPLFAIYEEDPTIIGATIHQVTTGIDSGEVIAQEKPKLRLDDDLDLLFYRTCKCGIDLLQKNIIKIILNKAKFKTLDKGKLYQNKDVTEKVISSARSKVGKVLYYDLDGAANQFIYY